MASTDLYALLKVDKDVQPQQLKKAYYALARKVHPDKRPGDEQAKADFLALKKAYGAALRLGADLAAGDEPRLCGLLHDLAAELALV